MLRAYRVAGEEALHERDQGVGLFEHGAVARAGNLPVLGARNVRRERAGQLRRRRLIERAAHHERAIADAAEMGREVESREAEAGLREALRIDGAEHAL